MMESEIVILQNNKKLKFEKNNLSLEKIRNFIKKEYKIPDQSFIELFDENYSKEICFVRDLEKLIVQTDSFNACIRINFKVRQTKEIKFNPMKISSDNKNIKINEIKNNNNFRISYKNDLNEKSETSEVKNSLREEMHRNNISIEDNNINEEAKKYKCEQEEEIKSLEKELNELKRINNDLENDDNNDIFLSDNLIEKLKKDIINEIISKIKDELNEKIKEINKNINQEESIKQYEKGINEEIERKGKIVYSKINAPIGEIMDKQSKIESKINNANKKIKEENLNQEKNQNFKNVEKVENKNNMNNINTNLFNKGNNHYKNKNYKYQVHENRIDNEEDNINKPNHKINQNYNIHLYNKQNINLNDRNNKNDNNNENKNFFNNLKVEVPKQIKNDIIVVPKKNEGFWNKSDLNNVNLLEIFNNIFFKDQHQKVINEERINDKTKYIIHKLFINHLNEERNQISDYAKNFILNNVLPIFQQSNINKDLLELVKFNISEILEAVGLDKNLYSSRYSPIYIKRIKNRQRSVEAAKRFRQEFQIKKEDINDEALIKKLDENDNDIYQTFQGIFGK